MLFYWVTQKAGLASRMTTDHFQRTCILWARVAVMVSSLYVDRVWQEQVHPQMTFFSLQRAWLMLSVEIIHLWLQHIPWAPVMNRIMLCTGETAVSWTSKRPSSHSLASVLPWKALVKGRDLRERSEGTVRLNRVWGKNRPENAPWPEWTGKCKEKGGHPSARGVKFHTDGRSQV